MHVPKDVHQGLMSVGLHLLNVYADGDMVTFVGTGPKYRTQCVLSVGVVGQSVPVVEDDGYAVVAHDQ